MGTGEIQRFTRGFEAHGDLRQFTEAEHAAKVSLNPKP